MATLPDLMMRDQTVDPAQRASVPAQQSPGWTKPVKRTLADVMKGVDTFADDMMNPNSGMDILKWVDQRPEIAQWLTMNMTPPGQMIQGSMDVSEAINSDAPWQNRLAQGAAGVLGMATAPLGVDTRLAGTAARGLNKLDDLARSGELMRPLQNEYGALVVPELAKQLDAGGKRKVYRAMQLIDGKLYPPMSAKVGGKLREPTEIGRWEMADEMPDLATDDGFFKLDKGNKKSLKARYNPYFHTSPSPLNDQFSEAYNRPNLVTVEVEIPESELTSGYKAEKAKDPVGEMQWHSGPVSSNLPPDKKRSVILSRYAKVLRVVPDSEIADHISGMLKGENINVPENVITPSLKNELVKRGVPVVPKGTKSNAMSIDDPDLKNAPWYHGSHEDKPITKESFKQGNPNASYPGFWVTKDRDFAESYAKGKPENTYRINLANDLDLLGQYQGKDLKKRVRMAAKDTFSRGEIGPEEYRQFVSELDALSRGEISLKDNNPLDNPTVQEVLSEQGFAGAIDNQPSGQTGVLFDPYYSVERIDPVVENAPWRQGQIEGYVDDPVERQKNFDNWFGDSKVVDESGKPLTVYHGTQKEFDQFKPNYSPKEQLGFGVHFTDDPSFAGDLYAEGKGGRVLPANLNLRNMLDADSIVTEGTYEYELAKKLAGSRFFPQTGEDGKKVAYLQNSIDATSPKRAEKLIREAGYDGIKYKAESFARGIGTKENVKKATSYIAFEPTQIKSIHNRGTYDPKDPRILYGALPLAAMSQDDNDPVIQNAPWRQR